MRSKLKGLLAVVLSLACFLSTTPIIAFAAGKLTASISDGAYTGTNEDGSDISSLSEGDEIVAGDEKGGFYVTVNGKTVADGYGETAVEGYKENSAESEKSGNVYYDAFTLPAAPTGYKDGAKLTVELTEDYYEVNGEWYLGNAANLEYTPIEYKVNFDLNGGEGEIEAVTAKYGAEFTLPDSESAAKEGYTLTGWNTAQDGSGDSYAPAASVKNLSETDNGEITLFAQWGSETEETEEYTVTYYLSETEQFGEPQSYSAGEKIELPAPPSKEGFKFAGWILGEKDGEAIVLPDVMPAENIKAYASWEVNSYEISYWIDGTNYLTKTAAYGSDIALTAPEDPEKEDYVFAGWFDENGSNLYSYTTVPAKDVAFTAKWLKNGNVVYMVGDKTYEAYEVTEGQSVPVPEDPEKFAHVFTGWTPAVPAVMPAEDLTFTAQWEIDKEFVTLVIGGTVIAGGIIAAIAGTAITGVSIIGGIIAILGVASGINKTYTVTYKVDGTVYKTYKIEAGEKITVPADPTKDGYVFAGWTPEIPDEMPKKNLTFEATWDDTQDDSNLGGEIPSTGSTAAGVAAFAALALSAAVAIIIKKKKES